MAGLLRLGPLYSPGAAAPSSATPRSAGAKPSLNCCALELAFHGVRYPVKDVARSPIELFEPAR